MSEYPMHIKSLAHLKRCICAGMIVETVAHWQPKFPPGHRRVIEKAQKNGVVGMAYGAKVHISTLAGNNPAAANQAYGWYCHKKGVVLIQQQKVQIHTQYTILEVGWTVLGNTIYNFAERLILPKTAASTSPNDAFNVSVATS